MAELVDTYKTDKKLIVDLEEEIRILEARLALIKKDLLSIQPESRRFPLTDDVLTDLLDTLVSLDRITSLIKKPIKNIKKNTFNPEEKKKM